MYRHRAGPSVDSDLDEIEAHSGELHMRSIRPRIAIAPLLFAATLAACSSGGGAATAGSAGVTQAPVATAGSNPTPAPVAAQGGASAGAYCTLFSADELKAFLGADAGAGSTDPAKPNSCQWDPANGSTVVIEKAPDEVVCEGMKAAATGGGATFDGDYWAGPEGAGDAVIGGVTIGGTTCFDVRITPAAKAPTPTAVIAFLKQLVQKAGG